jgi:G6PDH family F420-dependent oxidoreductase
LHSGTTGQSIDVVPTFGYHLSTEEHGPGPLVRWAQAAEEAGFDFLGISDHFHPWTREQGQSPFVWGVIGAIAQVTSRVDVVTAVTCPIVRVHPAIIAQAAATAQVMLEGRFVLGVGTGEALNEHVLGDRWPPSDVRREMLDEAVEVMRLLWRGGTRTHRGRHYTVEQARIFTLPETPPPVVVSAFGPRAAELAGRIGDGYVNTSPDRELLGVFHDAGGHGKPAYGKVDICWAPTREEAVRTAHRTWATSGLPGELAQMLPTPAHFEQAVSIVTPEMVADAVLCGPDPEPVAATIREYADAGYDRVLLHQFGADQAGFLRFWQDEVRPRVT